MPGNKTLKQYDLVVLYRIDAAKIAQTVETLIANNGGEIIKTAELGQKELAYQIDKEKIAKYVEYRLNLPATAPAKISQVLNITGDVLRYLLVKVDAKAETWLADDRKKREQRVTNNTASDEEHKQ